MRREEAVRICSFKAWMENSERDIPRFAKIVEQVERQIIWWLEEELKERQTLNTDCDREEWEAVIPGVIEDIKAGEPWGSAD